MCSFHVHSYNTCVCISSALCDRYNSTVDGRIMIVNVSSGKEVVSKSWTYTVLILYPDDIARLWHTDRHVLLAWLYCDHQSALAAYGIHPSRLICRRSHCHFYTGSCGKMTVSAAELHAMYLGLAGYSFSCISMALLTLFVDNWRTYHVILIDLYQADCQWAHAFMFCFYVTVGQDKVVSSSKSLLYFTFPHKWSFKWHSIKTL